MHSSQGVSWTVCIFTWTPLFLPFESWNNSFGGGGEKSRRETRSLAENTKNGEREELNGKNESKIKYSTHFGSSSAALNDISTRLCEKCCKIINTEKREEKKNEYKQLYFYDHGLKWIYIFDLISSTLDHWTQIDLFTIQNAIEHRERERLFILREYQFISVVGWMCGMSPNQAFDRIELQMTLIMLGRFRLGAKTKESTMWIWKGFQYRMHQPP